MLPRTAAGFTIRPVAVNPDTQIATITAAGATQPTAQLYLSTPGSNSSSAGDVDDDPDPDDVSVNGTPAVYTTNGNASAIRWEHAPDAEAVIFSESGGLTAHTMVDLAEAVRFTAPYQAKMPFSLAYLPAGLTPFHVVQNDATSVVQMEGENRVMGITIYRGAPTGDFDWQPAGSVDGKPTQCVVLIDGKRCAVDFGQFTVDVGSGSLAQPELAQIIEGMTVADFDNPATWYDIDDAIPGL